MLAKMSNTQKSQLERGKPDGRGRGGSSMNTDGGMGDIFVGDSVGAEGENNVNASGYTYKLGCTKYAPQHFTVPKWLRVAPPGRPHSGWLSAASGKRKDANQKEGMRDKKRAKWIRPLKL